MIADVVAWNPRDELPFDELTLATQWVIAEQLEESGYNAGDEPEIHFLPLTVYGKEWKKLNRKLIGFHDMLVFVVIVSNEELTEERGWEVYRQYMEQLEEEDDGGCRRTDGQPPMAPEEQGAGTLGGASAEVFTQEDPQVAPSVLDNVHTDSGSTLHSGSTVDTDVDTSTSGTSSDAGVSRDMGLDDNLGLGWD